MDMLRPLGDKILGSSGYFQYFSGPGENLTSDEKGDELFADFPEIDITAHEEVFMAAIRVAEGIGIVFENKDLARQSFLAQALLGNRQATFQDPLTGFIVDDQVKQVVAFGGGVFWMAARVLVETRPIREKSVGRPAIGDETLKNVPKDFFNRKVDPSIW
ncbi:MAG: hypothetical protein NPIRA03_18170 [Nitrospirales bacterium]|nr:MAG: hypothetical protein NPIRA03_18170 [Nitrospirales bacterium]